VQTLLPKLHWVDDLHFTVGDTNFYVAELRDARSRKNRLALFKWRWMVEVYDRLIRGLEPENIVELGIREGGSTAFLAAVALPKKIVAVDLDPTPNRALASHIETRGLAEIVKPYYGVDQADRERIEEILQQEYGLDPLDLVVDDASHLLEQTRCSFNILFPRLRIGGIYVIEDWPWKHVPGRVVRGDLTIFLFELLMACTFMEGLIDSIEIDRNMIRLRRGELPVDRDSFDISECYDDHARALLELLGSGGLATAGQHYEPGTLEI